MYVCMYIHTSIPPPHPTSTPCEKSSQEIHHRPTLPQPGSIQAPKKYVLTALRSPKPLAAFCKGACSPQNPSSVLLIGSGVGAVKMLPGTSQDMCLHKRIPTATNKTMRFVGERFFSPLTLRLHGATSQWPVSRTECGAAVGLVHKRGFRAGNAEFRLARHAPEALARPEQDLRVLSALPWDKLLCEMSSWPAMRRTIAAIQRAGATTSAHSLRSRQCARSRRSGYFAFVSPVSPSPLARDSVTWR